jgi:sugar phosphate permease
VPTYEWLMAIAFVGSLTGFGVLAWMPSFFIRVHGLSPSEIGVRLRLATAGGLRLGSLSSGLVADRLARSDCRWLIWGAGFGLSLCVPLELASLLIENDAASMFLFAVFGAFLAF